MTVKVENLTGGYGKTPVINNINFELKSGEIVGLIGLNGAGKSTTIKHMLGLLNPMQGKLSISNVDINEDVENYRKKLSYIPESPVIYDELTLQEHIYMTAMAYGIDRETAMERAEPLLQTFRLKQELGIFPSHFSKGMKQKVMIICAFIVNPELYIIDEPFLGLDPLGIQSMLDLMVEKKEEGRTVLMSTHILATAEKYCDRFIILDKGEIVAIGDLASLQSQTGMTDKTLDEIYIHVTQGGQQS
ncbi:ABC transporter ATP-binding protein [Staphylococcus arlettae]|jgi:ABC-2 type transport system ATP-binding protein|uniref:Multidrug ABC transporter ATP-binding protein n=1 Tax=Staphylococcus arlettae TaxID=29378 RepID=A0A380CCE6_9STAP|nr:MULTISPECIES: ABC transporter ATP-binding protein [Staphylococcus]EJY95163.1 multidrug ABC transporter ATPase [Staphylococcus arlettae CVD059]ERF49259.1 multidrug ABC transporter ATP-binding protein [Staphylococcus sp. EGD-HP3]MBF0738709.1 ABC transporter ATP-binding protein [Staphylococcus arlettae]MBK3720319.1 ABC-type transporter ATP-binding protein EcsA [Staphylococcus arlettae]MCD8816796.1 ABC transporter ATP-binding protein [Staphylococcus arlettae]